MTVKEQIHAIDLQIVSLLNLRKSISLEEPIAMQSTYTYIVDLASRETFPGMVENIYPNIIEFCNGN